MFFTKPALYVIHQSQKQVSEKEKKVAKHKETGGPTLTYPSPRPGLGVKGEQVTHTSEMLPLVK